jgi:primosomal protein N' (replication factor Y)
MASNITYIEVAIALPVYGTYTYSVPDELQTLTVPGKRVFVDFGTRKVSGYVLGPAPEPDVDRIKPITDVLDPRPLFPESMIPFFRWIADYYFHPLGEVIADALPGGMNLQEFVTFSATEEGEEAAENAKEAEAREIMGVVASGGPVRHKAIERKLGRTIAQAAIHRLERKGWIVREREIRGGRTRPKTERYAAIAAEPPVEGLSPQKQGLLEHLKSEGETPVRQLHTVSKNASRHLRELSEKGLVKVLEKPLYRDPFGDSVIPDTPPDLTLEQQQVLAEIARSLGTDFSAFLLAGVTGSGKTEVYMQAASDAMDLGFSVLILVPEIALIAEIERRFRARFGDCIAVLHSGLSAGERYDQWMRIVSGKSPIVIGARSAIFAPFSDIGLIIVDEEHDNSYKQESRCRYNARDLAVVRAKQMGATVVLGSATPSIQSVYNVGAGKFRELNLKHRIYRQPPPDIRIIDLREHQGTRGLRRIITPPLISAITETLERKEQVLLFLNRRGFASYPVCASCGEGLKCRNCDITLTLHKGINAYKCHLCGFTRPSVAKCGACGSDKIKQLGLGTEKIDEMIRSLFPQARVGRMDRDTTRHKGSLIKILKKLRNREIDILVGTQMVAKGHDFPNITLVGIICADLSLNFPDYRAGEITFQILAQVAGRAGRGTRPGTVLLQTYNPDHFSIHAARRQDFMAFYNHEIKFRSTFQYPPHARMIQLRISGKNPEETKQHADVVGALCRRLAREASGGEGSVQVLGPIEAPLSKVAGRYRWQILLKSSSAGPLRRLVGKIAHENGSLLHKAGVRVAIDVDPLLMM